MKDYRKFYKTFYFLSILLFFACQESSVNEQIYTGEAFGTSYQVKFFHPVDLELQSDLDSIFASINQSMSTYQATSDISRINAGDSTVVVDSYFVEVFELSQQIYNESDGYFDPTIGTLVNAYGFGPQGDGRNLNKHEIDSLLQYVGFNKLALQEDRTIRKNNTQIFIDFNAIAKGYAVDVLARYLDGRGVEDYLLEIGGELVSKGINKEKDTPWIVGVDNPLQVPGERSLQTALKLSDRAMATSGNYRKFKIDSITGQNYVHSVNPHTGMAEKSNLLSASVLAKNCALADGYATAFMVLGYEKSREMLERIEGVDVFFIYVEGNEMKFYQTEGFKDAILE